MHVHYASWNFIGTIMSRDYNSKIWNQPENVYRIYKTFTKRRNHTLSEQLAYSMGSSLKHTMNGENGFIKQIYIVVY